MKVLIADNDPSWSRFLAEGLRSEGISADRVTNGREALEKAATVDYDVILLDVLMPGLNGYAVLRKLRARGSRAAVLIVTCKGRERDELEGFSSGADDYLVKPIEISRLVARIHAILRRIGVPAGKKGDPYVLQAGELELHVLNREVRKRGKLVDVTKTEFSLLECMMRRPGQVLARPVLCQHLISGDIPATTNIIDAHMKNIRAKIDGRSSKSVIRTVRGVGYAILP